jgi:acyl-CoA-binding protein
MERPPEVNETDDNDDGVGRAEVEKWDAWYAQIGLSKTEAKRRYISTLIEV